MSKILNFTPHQVIFQRTDETDLVIPPQPEPIMVEAVMAPLPCHPADRIPIKSSAHYYLAGTCPCSVDSDDTVLVSTAVGHAVETMHVNDVKRYFGGNLPRILSPGSGPGLCVRDAKGEIVKSLAAVCYVPKE